MGLIFNEMVVRNYRAGFCSCSFLLCLMFSLVVLIVPFFLAVSTNGFWSSALIYKEQPIVLYNNELVVTTLASSQSISNSQLSNSLSSGLFSTIGWLNDLHSSNLEIVDIQSTIIDSNADLKPDLYVFNFTLYKSPISLKNLKIFIQFEYILRERVNLDMMGLVFVDINLPNGASEIFIDGDLRLKQRNPLKSAKVVRKEYNESVFKQDRPVDGLWERTLLRYFNRNETLAYDFVYSTKASGDDLKVKVNLIVRVPTYESIAYQPLFIQNLKFAWIQYLSLLIPLWYIVSSFAHYVFSQQIFETSVKTAR